MTVAQVVLILLAGVAAGAINTAVGSGTLVTFPTLVAFGYPPLTATMSNAVGLIPGNISGAVGYRRELRGQGARVRRLLPASLLGAVTGAALLLLLPEGAFERVVPVLLVLALLLVVVQPAVQRRMRARRESQPTPDGTSPPVGPTTMLLVTLATYGVGTYGGYFAAAQGVLLIAVLGVLLPDPLQNLNALKNVLVLGVNCVAATAYVAVAVDRIDWTVAGLVAAGSLVGGFLGAGVGRRLPAPALRGLILVLGVVGLWRLLS